MAVIGFLSGVVEVYVLLEYDAASMAVSFPTFRDNAVVSYSKVRVSKKNNSHNHQLDATISPVYYRDVYLQLNIFRASSRPSTGAQQML
jgi:hypothetical protein